MVLLPYATRESIISSQAHLHLGLDAHLLIILFQHRNVNHPYDKSRQNPLSLKCQATEMEELSPENDFNSTACTIDEIHSTTKMFIYLPKQNRTENLKQELQFICSFPFSHYAVNTILYIYIYIYFNVEDLNILPLYYLDLNFYSCNFSSVFKKEREERQRKVIKTNHEKKNFPSQRIEAI